VKKTKTKQNETKSFLHRSI